ncbi:unnamed protein product [Paramecium pentaurelia]|uniref:Uncharacterized protein n=1 Tax=Paramecium pentaurelia TaxID=43138 RepID=A0A8S1XB08_9CILI|nr:unnamed protein product [Paramecium pentaurelia]
MNSIERAKELLQNIKSKSRSNFDKVAQIEFKQQHFQQQSLIQSKSENLNSIFINDKQYPYQTIIQQQKRLASQFTDLMKQLYDIEQLFRNGLEENCLVQGLIGLQNLGTYMIKEFEILKKLQKPKQNIQTNTMNKECIELQKIYDEKMRIEFIQILLFIKQKVQNEKIKHMKEAIYNNDILIYDYGNIKKINQINQKLQIDGPIIQNQLQDRLINIKQMLKQKYQLLLREKQQLIDKSQQQELIQHSFTLQNLQKIENRASTVKTFIAEEYQILNQSLQQIKLIGIDFIYNSINENKNIIEYEKQQTKPLTYLESNSELGQIVKSQNNIIDIEKIMKQIKTWCKHSKIIQYYDDCSSYNLIQQCIDQLKSKKIFKIKELDELRQLFMQIQKL